MIRTAQKYYWLSCKTRSHMHVKKVEFVAEVILCLFIVYLFSTLDGNPSHAAGSIAIIHSFNFGRAIEAYQQAKTDYER